MDISSAIIYNILCILLAGFLKESRAQDDLLSCYIRAEAHFVMGDPSKGKFYSFTFNPPMAHDRETLDPCFMNCIMEPSCAAVLFYKKTTGDSEDVEEGHSEAEAGTESAEDKDQRCVSVVTDEAMRLEVMFGDVSDVFIKRGDKICSPTETRETMTRTTPPILLGHYSDNGYFDGRFSHLFSGSKGSKPKGKKPRVELNALNFLMGHQIFANIHHNSRNKQHPDIESEHLEENETIEEDVLSNIPGSAPKDFMGSNAGTPPPTGLHMGAGSFGNANGLEEMYIFDSRSNSHEPSEDGPQEPMGKEVPDESHEPEEKISPDENSREVGIDRIDSGYDQIAEPLVQRIIPQVPIQIEKNDELGSETDSNWNSQEHSQNFYNYDVPGVNGVASVLPHNVLSAILGQANIKKKYPYGARFDDSSAPTTTPKLVTTGQSTTETPITYPSTTTTMGTTPETAPTTHPATTTQTGVDTMVSSSGSTRSLTAFSATLTSTLSVTSSQKTCIIIFDHASLNEGGAYNTTSGVFRAPTSGSYIFTVDIQSPRGTLASVNIMHNEDMVHSIWAGGRNTGDVGVGSGTVGLGLEAGDKVFVKLLYESGYTYVLKDVSRFTGFKL